MESYDRWPPTLLKYRYPLILFAFQINDVHNFRLSILKFFEDTENELSTAHFNRHDDDKSFYLRQNNFGPTFF